uniref:Uncharacterized protein n=1 Tax=Acrobeloides nanus TaxID=290746 RepID=A0A914DVA5_9BILA
MKVGSDGEKRYNELANFQHRAIEIAKMNEKIEARKRKHSILNFIFPSTSNNNQAATIPTPLTIVPTTSQSTILLVYTSTDIIAEEPKKETSIEKSLKADIASFDSELTILLSRTNRDEASQRRIKELNDLKSGKVKYLKKIIDDRERKVQSRKRKAGESEAKNPMGRPRIEKQYDNLIEAIVDCVNGDAAAQGRRRDEALCSTTTIDQLQSRLSVFHNIDIKRSTLYTRLLPRASATIEGRRHFNCAPIRTCSIQRIKRSEHPDQHFAMASIKHFKGLAELFGPNSIFIFAQDDKARVPIGVPAIQRPEHDIDYLAVFTNAPGMSAFNPIERRMAPLSKALSGLVLPYNTFGSHLVSSKRTINAELEQKNFKIAGEILTEIWSEMKIQEFEVESNFIDPKEDESFDLLNLTWVNKHVRQTRYTLQIRKCNDRSCCQDYRSNFNQIFESFLPPPIPFVFDEQGARVATSNDSKFSFLSLAQRMTLTNILPEIGCYDQFCPSMEGKWKKQMCAKCNLYLPSIKAKNEHQKSCNSAISTMTLMESFDDVDEVAENHVGKLPEFEADIFIKKGEDIDDVLFDL